LADIPTPAGPTPRELALTPSSDNEQRDVEITPSIAGWEKLTKLTGLRDPIDQPFEDRTF
jgi:hypothetical protein